MNTPYKIGKLWALDYECNGVTNTVYSYKKSDLTNKNINPFI